MIKTGDWVEYSVEEATNAVVVCDDSRLSRYTPITVGEKVRLTVTSISEGIGYAVNITDGSNA